MLIYLFLGLALFDPIEEKVSTEKTQGHPSYNSGILAILLDTLVIFLDTRVILLDTLATLLDILVILLDT